MKISKEEFKTMVLNMLKNAQHITQISKYKYATIDKNSMSRKLTKQLKYKIMQVYDRRPKGCFEYEDWRYITVDHNGGVCVFESKPIIDHTDRCWKPSVKKGHDRYWFIGSLKFDSTSWKNTCIALPKNKQNYLTLQAKSLQDQVESLEECVNYLVNKLKVFLQKLQ